MFFRIFFSTSISQTNLLLESLVVYHLFMFILIVIVSWILELLNVFLLGILPLKKGTSALLGHFLSRQM